LHNLLDPLPIRLRRWVLAVAAVGIVTVAVSVALADSLPDLLATLTAVGLVVVAKTVTLRLRIGSERFMFAWGEAALVVILGLLPLPWIAPAVMAGVLISQLLTRASLVKMVYNSAGHAFAAAVAAVVIALAGGLGSLTRLGPEVAAIVCLAVVTYVAVTTVLASGAVAAASGSRFSTVATRGVGVTTLMMVGNVAVGLLVVSFGITDARWLIAVPPLLWLLNETYKARLRAVEERRAWQELAAATHRLNLLDRDDVLTAALRSACRLFSPDAVEITCRTPPCTVVGTPGGELVESGITGPQICQGGHVVRRSLAGAEEPVGELRLRFQHPVRLRQREQLALSTFADALGAALQNAAAHATLRDMAERKAYEAAHDSLTGLANRTRLLEYGESALRSLAGAEPTTHVALLLLDHNRFKEVNNTLGRAAGDQALQGTAKRLAEAVEPGELLARLGGDEFAVVIPGLPESASPAEYAAARARALVNTLSTPTKVAEVTLSIEGSVGVVTVPVGTCDMTELLRRADVAMCHAKRSGQVIAVYDPSRDAASTDRLALAAELRDALEVEDQLLLDLQPAVDLATQAPVGAEVLVRWNHPRRGLLQPVDFIGVVEQSELVAPFTRYVVDRALRLAASWAEEGLDVPVAVNLSARSLLDRRLPVDIAELLGRHKVPAERLILEITETVMMTELDVIDDVLGALREIGARIAVDDFGTGYSSLNFLVRFPVHEVKVDRSFVARLMDSPEARAIVRSTVDLARSLNLRVVAEGVETAAQRTVLADMGCDAAQGYYFFEPIPAEKTSNVLWTLMRSAEARGAQVIRLPRVNGGRGD
jgi:diguanylate cyclase (GGDEF)-like protein